MPETDEACELYVFLSHQNRKSLAKYSRFKESDWQAGLSVKTFFFKAGFFF